MSSLKIENNSNAITFKVKVVPASSKTSIAGVLDGMLKVKIAAPPEKGKANKSLIDFLSKKTAVKKKCITITSGQTNPVKTIRIEAITARHLLKILSLS